MNVTPPKWATRFLSWYCKSELLEDLQGDLNEYFDRNVKSKGVRRAKLIYILDVLKFLRLYTIRKPEFINLLIQWIMIGSYIKTSGRNIMRNKLFSTINIVGLGVSMSVGLIMIAMLADLYSYDKFHDKHNRIYRVISQHQYQGNTSNDFFATTSLRAAKEIKESISGPEEVAILRKDFSGDLELGEKIIPLAGFWSNEAFFRVFSFKLIKGNPATALKEPFNIVLTKTSARKLFGDAEAIGKTIVRNKKEYTVSGVMEDVPVFSHLKFDMLGSLNTLESLESENPHLMKWDSMWDTWAYLLMPEQADLPALKQSLDKLSAQEDKSTADTHIELALQPLTDIMTGENLSNQIGITMGKTPVRIFLILSFVVTISACFNYTNLSIARAFRRTKEVGIRKTIGALRGQVAGQFMVESITISLLALVFSFLLFLFVRPHFISMEESLQELLILDLSPLLIVLFILFAIVIGLFAGIIPALSFSRINAIQAFRNLSAVPALKRITARKVLMVFQYTISIIAITVTIILYKQYKHFIHYDLGFSTENILNIRLQGNDATVLKNELQALHEVKGISQSNLITGIGHYWITKMKNPTNPEDSADVFHTMIDENYLPLHNHSFLAGRNFQATADSIETEVIVNRHVLKRFNIGGQNPEKAIGEIVRVQGKDLTIIGVLKDFEYGKSNSKTNKEVIMRHLKKDAQHLNVKILSDDWPATYAHLEIIWKKIDPDHPFQAKFYNEQIEETFRGLKASVKIGGFLAMLVICIACIGLLGMVVFTTEIKLKEVSIRKVMGATEASLLYLLSRGFLILLVIATSIALPLTYLFFDKVMFPNIANHAPLGVFEMIAGALVVIAIAFFMITSQTLKAARTNPAEVLKNE
jgi:putative ABC transport system permease protein